MDPQSIRDRRRRRLLLVAGLALAVVAAFATYFAATRPTAVRPTPTPTVRTIVVAAADIPARSQITAEVLTTSTVPDNAAFQGVDTDPSAAVGKFALVDIAAGEPIRPSLYSDSAEAGLAILGPGETVAPDSPLWRAVSVQVPRERAVGGLVKTGDRIDLFVTLAPQIFDPTGGMFGHTDPELNEDFVGQGFVYSDSTTKVTWTNLEVLSADAENSLYVLRVTQQQAEEIAHVQASGTGGFYTAAGNSFTISLRPRQDERDYDTVPFGQTTMQLIDRYGFPLPVMVLPEGALGPAPSPSPEASPSPTPEP